MRILLFAVLLLLPVRLESSDNVLKSPSVEQAMEFINSNRPAEALKVLAEFQPAAEDISLYHYAYAKAYELSGKRPDSIAHYRLASIYSSHSKMSESAFLERAEAYLRMRYFPEAAISFRIFLKNFSDSGYTEKAHLGLADSLYNLGSFNEALSHYEKAGNSAPAIYGKANSYQSMGKINDAYELYMSMVGRDREYLTSSGETLFNIAENLRLMGKLYDAKIYFNCIGDPFFVQKANISLGLIAAGEAKFDSAVRYFNSASQSPDRQIRRRALLHLADTYLKAGKQEDAKSRLLEIRNKYPYGKDYDTALLILSRLYKKENKPDESISLIKELLSGSSPNKDTIDEFENIILDAKNRDREEFLKLWRYGGRWLLEPSRSKSLLEISRGLRYTGRPFLDLCEWFLKNAPAEVKTQGYLLLAEFYADIGDAEKALMYLVGTKSNNDDILRIRARIYKENKEYQRATDILLSIKDMKQEDIVFFSDLLRYAKNSKKPVEFFERALNRFQIPSKAYITLADTLYKMERKSEALKYYRFVISAKIEDRKDLTSDDMEWAFYMASKLSNGKDFTEMPADIRQGNGILARFGDANIKESNILERIKRTL